MKYETPTTKDYSSCLIRPMTENGDGNPIVEPAHVLDALIVAGIVFFSVLGGDALLNMYSGDQILITADQVAKRLITAGLAFGMVFLAQWARYRGIKFMLSLPVELDKSEKNDKD